MSDIITTRQVRYLSGLTKSTDLLKYLCKFLLKCDCIDQLKYFNIYCSTFMFIPTRCCPCGEISLLLLLLLHLNFEYLSSYFYYFIMKLVVLMFNKSLFNMNHLDFFSSILPFTNSWFIFACLRDSFVSSANMINSANFDMLAMLLIKRMNNRGPNIEPWRLHMQLVANLS